MDQSAFEQHIKDARAMLRRRGAECTVLLKKDGTLPLSAPCSVALYGNGARHTIFGGTGSGEVNTREQVSVEEGLKQAGFQISTGEWLDSYDRILTGAEKAFRKSLRKEAFQKHTLTALLAMGRIMKEPEYELPLTGEGDLGVYVLSRISGEGADREAEPGEILLTASETRDILAANERYEKFILVLNTCGVVDLSAVKDVKNILVLSQPGIEAGHILADLLLGKSAPSGHLTTTWAAWKDYCPHGEFGEPDETRYREGIYVGYRYFDTFGIDPVFPFGHGLTYTDFQITPLSVTLEGETVTVSVKVENTGNYAGREVLQLYVSAPSVSLDRPYQELAAFRKTGEVLPGKEEVLALSFSMSDLAAYRTEDACYLLESGDYLLRIGNSSRNTVLCGAVKITEEIICLKTKNYIGVPDFEDVKPGEQTVDNHADVMNAPVAFPVLIMNRDAVTLKTVTDQGEMRPEDLDPSVRTMEPEELIRMTLGHFDSGFSFSAMVGNSGFSVAGAAGETWLGGRKHGIPTLVMADGPAGLRLARRCAVDEKGVAHSLDLPMPESMHEYLPGIAKAFLKLETYHPGKGDIVSEQPVTALPVETAMAQSFDPDFAKECGILVGEEMEHYGVHLWLAPALNIHRDIRCGRNYEYYSEDPLLSGLMAAAVTIGVQSRPGCGVTVKHVAANNQEYSRMQSNSQVSERAFREIYMKGFGIVIRTAHPKALMTSYNLINGTHAGEHEGLIRGILRDELDYQGLIMTDWVFKKTPKNPMSPHPLSLSPLVIHSGGDLFMPGSAGDRKDMESALKSGDLTRDELRSAASRVATLAKELNRKENKISI